MRTRRKPDWLKMRPPSGRRFTDIKSTLRDRNLNTVCEEANCPNLGECWSGRDGPGTATFMLMGDRCSRGCNFCDVETGGMDPLDPDEPQQVADAVAEIGLDYVVLTSVDRDDLPDQGASHFAETIRAIKERDPSILVECLIPDFQGEPDLVRKIIDADPDVIAHDIETVDRLQWPVRDRRAGYEQSLSVLRQVNRESDCYSKTSLMLGVGEYAHEVYQTLSDLRAGRRRRGHVRPVPPALPDHLEVSSTSTPTPSRRGGGRGRRTGLPLLRVRPDGPVVVQGRRTVRGRAPPRGVERRGGAAAARAAAGQ